MPDTTQNLRHAEAGTDPVINFTYNELLEELRSEYGYKEREPGDITVGELAAALGLSDTSCREILMKKVREGTVERVKVKRHGDYRFEYVYRKVKVL